MGPDSGRPWETETAPARELRLSVAEVAEGAYAQIRS